MGSPSDSSFGVHRSGGMGYSVPTSAWTTDEVLSPLATYDAGRSAELEVVRAHHQTHRDSHGEPREDLMVRNHDQPAFEVVRYVSVHFCVSGLNLNPMLLTLPVENVASAPVSA